MKKFSMFAVAFALTALVACGGKKEKDATDEGMEDMTQQVEQGASETVTATEEAATEMVEETTEAAEEATK